MGFASDGVVGQNQWQVSAAIRAAETWVDEASGAMPPLALAQQRIGDLNIYSAAGTEAAEAAEEMQFGEILELLRRILGGFS